MKPSWNEEKFKQLFLQSKQADEQIAPSFASVWEAASRKANQSGHPRFALRLVVALMGIVVLGASAFFYFRHQRQPITQTEMAEMSAPPSNLSSEPPELNPVKRALTKPRGIARRAPAPRLRRSAAAISEWRSPTGSLLMTPGDEILKRVPRLGESVVELKILAP